MDQSSVLVRIGTSRKGVAAIVTTIGCTVAAVVLSWAVGTGRVTWDVYFARLEKLAAVVGAAWSLAGIGWSVEDAATKANSTTSSSSPAPQLDKTASSSSPVAMSTGA